MDGYTLSRNFFDWCFENPEKVHPTHVAVYFFAIEHCNRLGWKTKFGFPTQMAMDALGISKHHTYVKYLNDLVEWGFIEMIEKSKNQYSANIISIKSAMPKNGKALGRAAAKHTAKQTDTLRQSTRQSTGCINKPENQEPIINQELLGADAPVQKNFKEWNGQEFLEEVSKYSEKFSYETRNAFFKYWKEKNAAGKMKFQLEKTWETELRLETWLRNEDKFSKNGSNTNQRPLTSKAARNEAGFNHILNSLKSDLEADGRGTANSAA